MEMKGRVWAAFVLGVALGLALPLAHVDGEPLDPEAAALISSHRDQAGHLVLLGVDRWQHIGYRGQGIKIAILDTGFRGYRDQLGKTLPAKVQTCCFRDDGNFEAKNSQHGILCAEVLHALAPEAELLLVTWEPDSAERFLEAVRWSKNAGARIISCSILMPSWSDGEGGGEFHQKLRRILQNNTASLEGALRSASRLNDGGPPETLFFACAGNTAQRHWTGRFQAGTDGFHQWQPGQTANNLWPWSSDRVSVELYGRSAPPYEISVRDENGKEVSRSRPVSESAGPSIAARFIPEPQSSYQVLVRLKQGKPGNFHLVVLGGSLSTVTCQGSVACPADGPEVIAVGAVTSTGRRLDYSSCGADSQTLKPDFVAPVPFPTTVRSQAFTGTSAAAPQAAALAAILWSRHPHWNAQQVRASLVQSARDVGRPGPDCETGYGMISLPATP
jgi:subtilisin family serine protease